MKAIETGVDKLLALINKEKKIEMGIAAKALGVPHDVVQEWADFLDEEKLITVEYSLSKTYLLERKLTKKEVEKKTKEYSSKKEAFTRKVDTTLKKLEQETSGFEDIKKQYYELKQEIGDEIAQVKDEVDELRHYEELKKSIDNDVLQQKVAYEKSLGDIHRRITMEEKRYGKIFEEIVKEEEHISSERKDLDDLRKQEGALNRRLDALRDVVDGVKKQLGAEDVTIHHHEERLETLKELAEGLEKDIQKKRETELNPLMESSTVHQEKILNIQNDIIEKIKARKVEMGQHESQGLEIAKRFEKFFAKKIDAEKVVLTMEKQKQDMKKELEELIRKASAFDLSAKDANTKKHIKELESKFSSFDAKQKGFNKQLTSLKEFVTGKPKK